MDWINVVFWVVGTLVVVLGPLILIHELGHFVTAKLTGVRVEEFGFGFPPRLAGLWRGKGTLDIGPARVTIPLGFRLPPEAAVGEQVEAVVQKRDDGTSVLRHLWVVGDAKGQQTPKVREDEVYLRGVVTMLEPGTLYSLNWLPIGAFVRMTGEEDPSDPRSLAAQSKGQRLLVLGAGAVLNIVAAVVLLVGAYSLGYPDKWLVQISNVVPGTAAEAAGVRAGDVVVAINGRYLGDESASGGMENLQGAITPAAGQPVELDILRGDERLTLEATPRPRECAADEADCVEGGGFLGVQMTPWPDRDALRKLGVVEALKAGISDISTAIAMTLQVPARLAQGEISPEEARPASMVGISGVLAFSLQQSIAWGLAFPVMQTASLISLALGLTNLLPLPALDGGRIAFVLLEAVRGRRISPEREAMVHMVGMMILVGLMLFVMMQDFINPIIPWSWFK